MSRVPISYQDLLIRIIRHAVKHQTELLSAVKVKKLSKF